MISIKEVTEIPGPKNASHLQVIYDAIRRLQPGKTIGISDPEFSRDQVLSLISTIRQSRAVRDANVPRRTILVIQRELEIYITRLDLQDGGQVDHGAQQGS